jgi:hypothetical protein
VPPILPPQDGFLFLDKAKFAAVVRRESRDVDQAGDLGIVAGFRDHHAVIGMADQ